MNPLFVGLGTILIGILVKRSSSQNLLALPQIRMAPPMPSFNMQSQMQPLEKQISDLLYDSKMAYEKGGSVDRIVGSFAQAQELIHSPDFKTNYEMGMRTPVQEQIVEDFTLLGQKLSE